MMRIDIDEEIVARIILNDDEECIADLFNNMGDLVKKDCYIALTKKLLGGRK